MSSPSERKKRIDDAVRRVFRKHEYCALYVAGSFHAVSRFVGDNRGGWPVKLGVTRALEDTISANIDGASAYWKQGVLFRVWVKSFAKARQLERLVMDQISTSAEDLRKSFWDFGPDFQREFFEMEIHTIAQVNNIETWDDDSLMLALAREVKQDFESRGRG